MSKRPAPLSPTGLSPEGKKANMNDNWNILKDCGSSYDKCKISLVKLKSELSKPKGGSKSIPEANSILAEHSTDISCFMEKVMKGLNGLSEIIDDLRSQVKSLNEERLTMADKVSDISNVVENISVTKSKQDIMASQAKMKDALKESGKCSKVLNMDFGHQVNGRDNIIKAYKDLILGKVNPVYKAEVENLLDTTEIFPLGKETKLLNNGTHTVPMVMKFASHKEKFSGEKLLLKSNNIHGSFLWPKEAINQVQAIRKLGNSKFPNHYIKIRPDYNDDCKLKLDIKGKSSSDGPEKFKNKMVFSCPTFETDRVRLNLAEIPAILKENTVA